MEYIIKKLFHMIKAHHSSIQLLESLLERYLTRILEQNFSVISTSFFLSLLFRYERGIFKVQIIEYNKSDSLVFRGQFALQCI